MRMHSSAVTARALYDRGMNRVLIIDDDEDLSGMLRDYLHGDGFQVSTAADGERGIAQALSQDYDIAVLDVMMPGMSGLEVLRRVRQQSSIPVVMLTARGDDVERITGLELGADDYVPKPCTPRELSARLRAIMRRLGPPSESPDVVLESGALRLRPAQRQAEWAGRPLQLTSTEFNLLEILLRHAGRPVSKPLLYEQVLGRPASRHDRSIDVHVSSVRRKLGVLGDGRPPIVSVFRQGYQLLKD